MEDPLKFVITFGKYSNMTIEQILNSKEGLSYARWIITVKKFSYPTAQEMFRKALKKTNL